VRLNEWCKYAELLGVSGQTDTPRERLFNGEVVAKNDGDLLQAKEHKVVVHWQAMLAIGRSILQ